MTEAFSGGEQMLQDAEAHLAAIEATSREVAAITAVARMPDGSTVTVGAGGSVRSIDLSAESLNGSPAELGASLVAAIAAASADVARQSAQLMAERTGIDITERIAAAQVLAGDPVAVAAQRDSATQQDAAATDDEDEQDWLRQTIR